MHLIGIALTESCIVLRLHREVKWTWVLPFRCCR